MWKRAITAAVLVLSAGSAFAADAPGGSQVASAAMPTRTVSQTAQGAAVRNLSDRVNTLEREVGELTPPAPTPEERQLSQREQENDARLVRHAWTDGG